MTSQLLDVSVVICAYTEQRWDDLIAAVESVHQQTVPAREIIVVSDHNSALLERVRGRFPQLITLANHEAQGLSGARNSGVAVAQGAIIVFLDDDAEASPDWLEQLLKGYADPQVLGVGGSIEPRWLSGRPSWFPEEFGWVVGCTYRGMPKQTATVRNLIGANMSFRREVFEDIRFRNGVGQVGTSMLRCDDTEFCIQINQYWPHVQIIYMPAARVHHRVPATRTQWHYFHTRCFTEGQAKAMISRLVGARDGLSSERAYTLRTLPLGVLKGLSDALLHLDASGLQRAGAIALGLTFTTAGFLKGNISARSLGNYHIQVSHGDIAK